MAKKISFDNLPSAVEKIVELLTAEGTDHTALPELAQRMTLLEKRCANIERLLSPDRPLMDKQTVMRVLKVRPKVLVELENEGLLISHSEGRRSVYYEDDVVRFYMSTGWRALVEAASKTERALATESTPKALPDEPATATDGQLVDIDAAVELVGLTKLTLYKLTSNKKIPFVKQGSKNLFDPVALKEWMESRTSRKRKDVVVNGETVRPRSDNVEGATGEHRRVDMAVAGKILDRTPSAIYQLITTGSVPHYKDGRKVYFFSDELEEWIKTHPPRKRKSKSN